MLQGVIFDMDGLLFDTEPVWGAMWGPVLARYGIHETRGIEDKVRGTAGAAMAAIVRETFGPDVDAESIVADEFASVEREILAHPPQAKPGVEELTGYLAELGTPMAIASSSAEELIRSNIRAAGIAERFSVLLSSGSAGVKRGKPAPDVFLAAAERLSVEPAHTLVLEDAPNGVRAGRAGGFITVMVPDLIAPTPELLALTDACCTSLFEVRDLIASGKLG